MSPEGPLKATKLGSEMPWMSIKSDPHDEVSSYMNGMKFHDLDNSFFIHAKVATINR